jgi:WD40 repeat protein
VRAIAFSPDGQFVASGGGKLQVWQVPTKKLVRTFRTARNVNVLAFSRDGSRIAIGLDDGTVEIQDIAALEPRITLPGHARQVRSLAFSPDGKTLASGADDDAVRLWDVESRALRLLLPGHGPSAGALAFSGDGDLLAVAGAGGAILLWNVKTGNRAAILKGHERPVDVLAFLPGGRLVSGDSATVRLWQTTEPRQIHSFQTHAQSISMLSPLADAKKFAAAFLDKTFSVFETSAPYAVTHFHGPAAFTASRHCVSYCPATDLIATGDSLGTVWLWRRARSPRFDAFRFTGHRVGCAALCASSKLIAFRAGDEVPLHGADPSGLEIWDLMAKSRRKPLGPGSEGASVLKLSKNGQILASSCENNTIQLWDVQSGRLAATLLGNGGQIRAIDFAPGGDMLASADEGGNVTVWNAKKADKINSFRRSDLRETRFKPPWIEAIAFSVDGKSIASGYRDGSIAIWSIAGARPVQVIAAHDGLVSGLAFSPDGVSLASCGLDGAIKVWSVGTWKATRSLVGYDREEIRRTRIFPSDLRGLAFSPNGEMLAWVGGYGLSVVLWDLRRDRLSFVLEQQSRIVSFDFTTESSLVTAGSRGWVTSFDFSDVQ